jgi:hypothetical protein
MSNKEVVGEGSLKVRLSPIATDALTSRIGSSVPLTGIAPAGRGSSNADTLPKMHCFIAVAAYEG